MAALARRSVAALRSTVSSKLRGIRQHGVDGWWTWSPAVLAGLTSPLGESFRVPLATTHTTRATKPGGWTRLTRLLLAAGRMGKRRKRLLLHAAGGRAPAGEQKGLAGSC